MWQRFTERARKVVFYAQEEAQKFGEGYVSTEHLLLGLVRETDSLASRIFEKMGASPNQVRHELEKLLPKGDKKPGFDMTLTPRAKRVIDLAYEEARLLNNNYIGTEHLLLGLIREGEGLAGQVLIKLGIELATARQIVLELQDNDRPGPSPTTEERPRPSSPAMRLPVYYDLQLVQPIDQMLLAILSDRDTPLGQRFRRQCPSLDWILPAIVANMSKDRDRSGSVADILEAALAGARSFGRDETTVEDLYAACIEHTSAEIRAVLSGLGLLLSDS